MAYDHLPKLSSKKDDLILYRADSGLGVSAIAFQDVISEIDRGLSFLRPHVFHLLFQSQVDPVFEMSRPRLIIC